MLWAIDVGNSHTVYGFWSGDRWVADFRLETSARETEDSLAATLKALLDLRGLPFTASDFVVASVVPAMNETLTRLAKEWLNVVPKFLTTGEAVGIDVIYDPPSAVGADRLANALGGLAKAKPPMIIIDFGTATTFDAIGASGEYLGGSILPGVRLALEALSSKTAKLPQIEIAAPPSAIGQTTPQAMQSGLVLGYADAIDGLARRFRKELGGHVKVLATGGLGEAFGQICQEIDEYDPYLTLNGLKIAANRLTAG